MANSFATPEVGSDSVDTIEKDGDTNHNDTDDKINPKDVVRGLIMGCRLQLKAVLIFVQIASI